MKSYCLFLCVCATFIGGQERFQLNILHYNDFHARFVETSPKGGVCKPEEPPCIGGFARLTTKIRERLAAEPDSLLLNGGDSFQGTIWYNILRWNVTQEFMNILPHDAHVLGNHEFDSGVNGVVPYLQHLKQPVVTANIIVTDEPTLQGLVQPSIVVERRGRKIGIIGVLVANTNQLSYVGKVKFTDEATAVKIEAEKLNAKGVKIIIVLSHCGVNVDKNIALHGGPYLDIIVGGHSHTLLTNKPAPNLTTFEPQGPYPIVVEKGESKVLIVQAAALSQFLGEIKLYFDEAGNVLEWEGEPYFLGPEIEQEITYASVLMAIPFENTVQVFDLRGDVILEILEHAIANKNVRYPGENMVQISGIHVVLDGALPINSRVVNATVRCIDCDILRYFPLQRDKYYKIVSISFLGGGGSGFEMIPANRQNVTIVGTDYELLIDYIQRRSPILALPDGRLQYSNPCITFGDTDRKRPLLN